VWCRTISRASWIVNDLSGSTVANSARAWGSVSAGVFFKTKPQPQQKVQREEHIEHMPVPCRPGAMFILIHANMAFAVLEALLYRPAHR